MNEEEKRQAILAGQQALEAARRDKRAAPSNGTGQQVARFLANASRPLG